MEEIDAVFKLFLKPIHDRLIGLSRRSPISVAVQKLGPAGVADERQVRCIIGPLWIKLGDEVVSLFQVSAFFI